MNRVPTAASLERDRKILAKEAERRPIRNPAAPWQVVTHVAVRPRRSFLD